MEVIIIIVGFLLDRATKIWAALVLLKNGDIVIINGFFSLSYLENRGAAFGIFHTVFIRWRQLRYAFLWALGTTLSGTGLPPGC